MMLNSAVWVVTSASNMYIEVKIYLFIHDLTAHSNKCSYVKRLSLYIISTPLPRVNGFCEELCFFPEGDPSVLFVTGL